MKRYYKLSDVGDYDNLASSGIIFGTIFLGLTTTLITALLLQLVIPNVSVNIGIIPVVATGILAVPTTFMIHYFRVLIHTLLLRKKSVKFRLKYI